MRLVWHWFSPGRGREQKLEVSAWRSVSRCWWRRLFRPLSCNTSPSSRSTAARMLSTCFCRAALRSSYSMWVFRSCRISASRAVRAKRHAETLRQWRSSEEVKRVQRAVASLFFYLLREFLSILGPYWWLRDYSGRLERQRKMRDAFINTKGRRMFKTKCSRYSSSSPLLWLRNSSVKIGMSNTVRSFPSVSFCW